MYPIDTDGDLGIPDAVPVLTWHPRGSKTCGTPEIVHRVLTMVLGWAVETDRIARNPASSLPAASPAGGRHTFLTHAEVEALAVAAGRSRVLILFLANTGLRFGGISALRVGDVDLAARRVAVNRAWAGQNTGESVPVGAEDP